jgi:hypothetical protein
MQPRNAILRFLVIFAGIYALLVVPWPRLADLYLGATHAVGARMFGSFGPGGAVSFQRHPTKPWTSVQALYRPRTTASLAVGRDYDCRQDYLATALVTALILATPIPARRKVAALALGLLLINAFVLWRIWIGLVDVFSDKQLDVIQLSPFWKEAVRLAVQIFVGSIEATFIVPIFVWIVVSLRRSDLEMLLNKKSGGAPRDAAGP